jgi:hypothetical protein
MSGDNLDVLAAELRAVGKTVGEIRESIHHMRDSMTVDRAQVIRLEERYLNHAAALERAFAVLTTMEGRIKEVEVQQPITKLVTGWVITGVVAVCGMGALQVWTTQKNAERPVMVVDREIVERWKSLNQAKE